MLEKNLGMLLYGPKGTGKTFLACAVANALLEKLVPVSVTSFPEILNRLWRRDADRQGYIDRLSEYKLLVVDDLGAERDTPYACEQVYNVIDSRLRSGLPLIVTTNLTLSDLENETDIRYARIYDRILEMCPLQLCLSGESRRRVKRSF